MQGAFPGGDAPLHDDQPFKKRKSFANQVKDVLRTRRFYGLFLTAFAVYLFLVLFYTFGFMKAQVWCVAMSILGGIASFALLPFRRRGEILFPLALLILLATVLGTVLGLYAHDSYAIYPMFYANSRTYTNVVPSESAAAVADAGKISFTAESLVNTAKSASWITEQGWLYCVAPIVDATNPVQVEFWASGIDCCDDTGKFDCDGAHQGEAHSGVVVFENHGFFTDSRHEFYEKARRKAEAKHGLLSGRDPLYVRWVKDTELGFLASEYQTKGIVFLVVVSFFILIAFALGGLLMMPEMKG